MRKIFSAIILGVLVFNFVAVPIAANAVQGIPEKCDTDIVSTKTNVTECSTMGDECSPVQGVTDYSPNCGFCCMLNTIYKVTKWMFYILMLLVTIFIIYGGFIIITSSGDPEKAGKGRQILTYAVVGLAIALLARVIPSLVRFVIGV